ncbi:MAG: hypothetical protein JWN79_1708, partial [Gemmatimonadetes bacterium]|nr:hypothetical protein [Gemmatimonadota bacterium]
EQGKQERGGGVAAQGNASGAAEWHGR